MDAEKNSFHRRGAEDLKNWNGRHLGRTLLRLVSEKTERAARKHGGSPEGLPHYGVPRTLIPT